MQSGKEIIVSAISGMAFCLLHTFLDYVHIVFQLDKGEILVFKNATCPDNCIIRSVDQNHFADKEKDNANN